MSTSPPCVGSKKLKPRPRSSRTKNCEAAMKGVAMTTSSEVEKFAHTSRGMRKNDLHGDGEELLPDGRRGAQRRVGRPPAGERAAGSQEGEQHHRARDGQQPVGQRV